MYLLVFVHSYFVLFDHPDQTASLGNPLASFFAFDLIFSQSLELSSKMLHG